MIEKFMNKDKLTPEQIDMAYAKIKEHCDENNLDVLDFVKDESNIPLASQKIQSQLPFAMRLVVKPKHLEEAIRNNLDFIINVATERYSLENSVIVAEDETKIIAKNKIKAESKGKKKKSA